MKNDDLINELIVEGATKLEAHELANFSDALRNTLPSRSETFKLKQFELVQGRLEKRSFSWRRVLMPAGLGLGSVGLLAGTVFASQASLPGEPLYQVKRISEQVLTTIYPHFADNLPVRRTEEVKQMIEKNKDGELLKNNLEDYSKEIDKNKPSPQVIEQTRTNLQQAEEKASGTAKEEIQKVLQQGEVKSENRGSGPNSDSNHGGEQIQEKPKPDETVNGRD